MRFRTSSVLVVLAVLAVLAVGCETALAPDAGVVAVAIAHTSDTLQVGDSVQLTATVTTASSSAIAPAIAWTTSDSSMIRVSSRGMISAISAGSASIAATAGGKKDSTRIVARRKVAPLPTVASVTVSPATATLRAGTTTQLSAAVLDSAGRPVAGATVAWTTSNGSAAAVGADGVVTGMTPGSATISATSGGKTGTANVTVTAALVQVSVVTVTPGTVRFQVGGTSQLAATLTDSAGRVVVGPAISWVTSNAASVTVSSQGLVTGRAAGSATITATSLGKSGTASVTITSPTVQAVTVTPATATLRVGATAQLAAAVTDSIGRPIAGQTVTWTSSSPATATVSSTGSVRGVAPGSATITAASGGKSGTASVTITAPVVQTITVTPAAASVQIGGSAFLTAVASDSAGSILSGVVITWAITDPTIATINAQGMLTGIATGSTLVTATSGGKSGTAAVSVTAVVAGGACTPTGSGICRYVDGSAGNDANPGTSTQPYRSLAKAAGVVNPGDVVIVRDGIYTGGSGAILDMGRGGTATNLVVFKAEHQWAAILDGQSNTSTEGIRFNASYERVEGFEVRNIAHDGMDMPPGLTGLQAAGLHIHDVGRMCEPPSGWGLSAYTADASNVIIEQNVIHDIGRYGPGEFGCVPSTPYYQNNDHGIYVSSGSNIIIRNNVFYRLQHGWAVHRYNTGGAVADHVYIVNNTFAFPNPWRDGQIVIGSPLTNSVIANNIFYQPSTAGILFDAGGPMTNVQVMNNVTYGGVVSTGPSTGATLTNNLNNTDPRLANAASLDFHLLAGSPAIAAGLALSYVLNDFVGAIRAANDIGAYKY